MNRRDFAIGAGAVAVATGGYALYTSNSAPVNDGFARLNAQDAAADIDTSVIQDMVIGDENAPLTMVEYASFTCPHCASFHANVYPSLKQDYIDTGKIKFVFREVYFDRFGLWASMLARCGGQDRFFGVTDLLFEKQSEWLAGGQDGSIAANLNKIGLAAGFTEEEIQACFQDTDMAQTLIAWYQENATKDEVRATPSFIIGGDKQANVNYTELKEVLDAKL